MNRINEHQIEPGTYRHHKGAIFVVTDLVTHEENAASGDMEELPWGKMKVIYRDVERVAKHVNGKLTKDYHQTYCMTVEDFFKTIDGKPRFTKE